MVSFNIFTVLVDILCCHWEISQDWLRDYSTFKRYHGRLGEHTTIGRYHNNCRDIKVSVTTEKMLQIVCNYHQGKQQRFSHHVY